MDVGGWELGAALAKALTYAATLGAAGLGLFYLYATPLGYPARDLQGPILRLAAAAALLTAVKFPLLAGAMDGLAGVRSPKMLHTLAMSGEGMAALLRGGGLALLCLGGVAPGRPLLLAAGALLAAASFAASGHVHAHHNAALSGLLALHLLGAAFWIGALWPLGRLLERDPQRAAPLIARFSRLALAAVPLLLVAGGVLLSVLLGAVSALWTSTYGRWLCVKLSLVGALLALAVHNRQRLTPLLGTPRGCAAMRRVIRAEMVVVAGVLLVTATVTTLLGPGD